MKKIQVKAPRVLLALQVQLATGPSWINWTCRTTRSSKVYKGITGQQRNSRSYRFDWSNWSQGPIGPQGPTGPTGPTGSGFVYYQAKSTLGDVADGVDGINTSYTYAATITIGVTGKYVVNVDIDTLYMNYNIARSDAGRVLVHILKIIVILEKLQHTELEIYKITFSKSSKLCDFYH